MATFNLATNRVIAGICEFCGTSATACGHYKDNPIPTDELKKLEHPAFMPKPPVFAHNAPLAPEEIAGSREEAMAKKAEADAKMAEEVVEAPEPAVEPEPEADKPRAGRPPLPRDPVTGEIIRS